MRRIAILALVFLCGCRGVRGPFDPVSPARVDDPNLTIAEQERLGRDRYALPDESDDLAPPSSVASPNVSPYPH